jgi:hypothetical protein
MGEHSRWFILYERLGSISDDFFEVSSIANSLCSNIRERRQIPPSPGLFIIRVVMSNKLLSRYEALPDTKATPNGICQNGLIRFEPN